MNKLKNILQKYNLYPFHYEKLTSGTIKVFTGNQYIVLKQSNVQNLPENFHFVYKIANKYQISSIIPLLLSEQNEMVVSGRKHYYYVMPWIKEKLKEESPFSSFLLFKELARIHQKTLFRHTLENVDLEKWSEKQQNGVQRSFHRFERWISSFEGKHFMSPAELLLCYLYAPFREICKALEYWYGEWEREMEETKIVRLSLCHGHLTPSHYLRTEKGPVLLNWERAHIGEGIKDIANYYVSICQFSDIKRDDLIENIKAYEQQHQLLKSEYASLAIHLLQMNQFMKKVHLFVKNRKFYSEIEWVQKFERFHIHFNHMLFLQNYLKDKMMEENL